MDNKTEILALYDTLSKEDKIRLYISLSNKDMREHFDPSYKRYRIVVKNVYGKLLVDRWLEGSYFNEREARRFANRFVEAQFRFYEPLYEKAMDKEELIRYRNLSYTEIILTETK